MTPNEILGSPPKGYQWRSIKDAAGDLGLAERTIRRKIAADELVSRATGNKRTDQKFVAVPSDKVQSSNDASNVTSSDAPTDRKIETELKVVTDERDNLKLENARLEAENTAMQKDLEYHRQPWIKKVFGKG